MKLYICLNSQPTLTPAYCFPVRVALFPLLCLLQAHIFVNCLKNLCKISCAYFSISIPNMQVLEACIHYILSKNFYTLLTHKKNRTTEAVLSFTINYSLDILGASKTTFFTCRMRFISARTARPHSSCTQSQREVKVSSICLSL